MKNIYTKILLFLPIRILVLIAFFAMTIVSLFFAQGLKLGLDQRTALPGNSYLKEYFGNQTTYLDIGPPVYLVNSNKSDFTLPSTQRDLFKQYDLFTQTPFIDKGIIIVKF
jgi:hypothetical protein